MNFKKTSSFVVLLTLIVASSCNPPPPAQSPIIEIQITGSESRELGIETISQPNCTGTAEVANSIEKSRTIAYTIEVQNGASVNTQGQIGFGGASVELGATIASQFGQSYGTSESISRSITVQAGIGTDMQHTIRQLEVWKVGEATVSVGSQKTIIPFKFRSDFAIELVSSRDLKDCSGPTPAATQLTTEPSTIALSDSFNGSTGSYDSNLWDCGKECGFENLFLQDGTLHLKRSNEGLTHIISHRNWDFDKLASLAGKYKVSQDFIHGELGWLSIFDSQNNVFGCGVHGAENPYIQCDVSSDASGRHDYDTQQLPIKFDTWFSIEIDFDQKSNSIRFYVDDTVLGEYILTKYPDTMQVNTGIYSPISTPSGQIYVDDILLTLHQ